MSSVTTSIPHLFEKRDGLSDPSLMQQWLTPSSSCTPKTEVAVEQSAAAAAGVDKLGVPGSKLLDMPIVVSAVSSSEDDSSSVSDDTAYVEDQKEDGLAAGRPIPLVC